MPYRPPPPKLRMQGQQVPTSQALPRGQPISGPRVPPSTMIAQEGWPAPERRRQSGGLRGTTTDDTMTNMPPLSDPHTLPAPVQTPSRGFCLHQSQHSTSDQSPCHPYRCTHPLPPILPCLLIIKGMSHLPTSCKSPLPVLLPLEQLQHVLCLYLTSHLRASHSPSRLSVAVDYFRHSRL